MTTDSSDEFELKWLTQGPSSVVAWENVTGRFFHCEPRHYEAADAEGGGATGSIVNQIWFTVQRFSEEFEMGWRTKRQSFGLNS